MFNVGKLQKIKIRFLVFSIFNQDIWSIDAVCCNCFFCLVARTLYACSLPVQAYDVLGVGYDGVVQHNRVEWGSSPRVLRIRRLGAY